MPTLALFGRPILTGADAVVVSGRPAQRHCLALLALLAAERRGLSRDRILGYLWPESDATTAGHRLSVSLHLLRQQLGAGSVASAGDALLLGSGWRIDAREFEDLSAQGQFEAALALYRAPLLDGFFLRGAPGFEEWLEGWRTRLERRRLAVLEELARDAARRNDRGAEVAHREAIVAADPGDRVGVMALLRALAAAGRPEQALARARAHALLLREEYGMAPSPAVTACAGEIARSHFTTSYQ